MIEPALSQTRSLAAGELDFDEGRFPSGTLLAGRYRIVGLIGRGGMGAVYRATDLVLGQSVALKFLPEDTQRDERAVRRLHQEVLLARRISHPNVCRVYDIGTMDGQPYISMEYVDGEDLGSLLRRIGRLPGDKAVEIARQVCAGLSAAHGKGILHRDLKPSNIMINGRGEAVITDFGLAGVADQIQRAEIGEGTPAYMAPEQLAGREVSAKSDLYSLGLVMYEMFTGKRAFPTQSRAELERLQTGPPASPSSAVRDLDLAVERVILRCLSADPRLRPSSAMAVAGSLGGEDPLAAALAWGRTPSPELVAAAGEDDRTHAASALLCLGGVVIGLLLWAWLAPQMNMLGRIGAGDSPEALRLKAHDLMNRLGYSGPYLDSAEGMTYSRDYRYAVEHGEKHPPAPLRFWYRQSPRYLVAKDFLSFMVPGVVTLSDPPPVRPGMTALELDAQGRLVSFAATPAQHEVPAQEAQAPDWDMLFSAAGLERARFQPAAPEWAAASTSDLRKAWTGIYPDASKLPLRIEAAAWRGKLVNFQTISPWTQPLEAPPDPASPGDTAAKAVYSFVVLSILVCAALLARANVRRGRADQRGAFRLAVFLFIVSMLLWVTAASHVPSMQEFSLAWAGFSAAISISAVLWLFYVAMEPYVRRRWPRTLIGWSRLLTGSVYDPVVGRDMLIGTLFGITGSGLFLLVEAAKQRAGAQPPMYPQPYTLAGGYGRIVEPLGDIRDGLLIGFAVLLLMFLLRVLLRNQWAAAAASILIFTSIDVLRSSHPGIEGALVPLAYALSLYLLLRYGLLAYVTGITVNGILNDFPITLDWTTWYSREGMFAMGLVLAVAIYGFRASLGGRPLFQENL